MVLAGFGLWIPLPRTAKWASGSSKPLTPVAKPLNCGRLWAISEPWAVASNSEYFGRISVRLASQGTSRDGYHRTRISKGRTSGRPPGCRAVFARTHWKHTTSSFRARRQRISQHSIFRQSGMVQSRRFRQRSPRPQHDPGGTSARNALPWEDNRGCHERQYGIAYAMIGAAIGYPVKLFLPH